MVHNSPSGRLPRVGLLLFAWSSRVRCWDAFANHCRCFLVPRLRENGGRAHVPADPRRLAHGAPSFRYPVGCSQVLSFAIWDVCPTVRFVLLSATPLRALVARSGLAMLNIKACFVPVAAELADAFRCDQVPYDKPRETLDMVRARFTSSCIVRSGCSFFLLLFARVSPR